MLQRANDLRVVLGRQLAKPDFSLGIRQFKLDLAMKIDDCLDVSSEKRCLYICIGVLKIVLMCSCSSAYILAVRS